ncbi:methylthioribulose 1-phosphate dehydratase [Salinisphaera aquimarina]|uniref:Methylthioribulose-1-phosphate dehydratase n=1 Tax=Salinisphaera aquimarina TaxID=2094031 RepID=A0ABV7EMB7_9GAMM
MADDIAPNMQARAAQLCDTARFFAARGLCPATGGNFSTRADDGEVLITASGLDKGTLSPADLLPIALDGTLRGAGRPSAETGLHLALYRRDPAIGAVLHVHSIANTLLSRLGRPSVLTFDGYEMQKAISGNPSHEGVLRLPVLDNSQDMDTLATALDARFDEAAPAYGFLVRGHGIYAWGADIATARRHLEGWEFLLACELARRQLETRS